jgi:hypothetical protein
MHSFIFGKIYGTPICLQFCLTFSKLLVMSPSWNFPARAEPSYKGSEPSRAELEHLNFRAENELAIFLDF